MNFKETLVHLVNALNEHGVDYTIIGALALTQCGIQRNTVDIDFLVREEDEEKIEKIMTESTYELTERSDHFSQFQSPIGAFGNVDFLRVSEERGRRIIEDSLTKRVFDMEVRMVRVEDLVGLKVLAYSNDKSREPLDKKDIAMIHEVYNQGKISLDLERIAEYYRMFEKGADYDSLWKSN